MIFALFVSCTRAERLHACMLMLVLQVSNASGYLCHIDVDCTLDVPPEVLFEIFCHPDNAGAFRDIKKVGYRKVRLQQCNSTTVL